MQQYEAIGASLSLSVRSCLPKDWDWSARRPSTSAAERMNVVGAGRPWNQGGRWIHSEWWVRAHRGRAFEVIEYQTNAAHPGTHGRMVLRKRPTRLTTAEVEQPEPGDPESWPLRVTTFSRCMLRTGACVSFSCSGIIVPESSW